MASSGELPVLTRREQAVMALFDGDEVNHFRVADECWPLVINVRYVVNRLVRGGLVKQGAYIDEEHGSILLLTDAGREWAAASGGGDADA